MTQIPPQQNFFLTRLTQLVCWLFVTRPTTGYPTTSRPCASAALHPSTDELCSGEATAQTVPTYVQTWQIQTQQYFWHVIGPNTCEFVPHGEREGLEIGLKARSTSWWRNVLIYSAMQDTQHSWFGCPQQQGFTTVTEEVFKCKPAKRWAPKIRPTGDTTALRVRYVHDWKCSGGLQNVSDKLRVGVW